MASDPRRPDPLTRRLAALAPDQRAAATAPPGPVLCIAPAGSGKTTTLVARIAWLIGGPPSVRADEITAITFNRRAAEELQGRLGAALGEIGVAGTAVRVRTFHALGREILASSGVQVERLVDRMEVIATLWPNLDRAGRGRLDAAFSTLKLEHAIRREDVAADPAPGPLGEAFVRYEAALAGRDALDFDDLVARSVALLSDDPAALAGWRASCRELLVDEVQDVDRSQLRLALLLAAPANRIFLVGDDDQSIYGWRLADVRRVLRLAEELPGLRRVDLETNYRCPAPVVSRAVRLIEHNRERFPKTIRPRPGARGRLVLAPTREPPATVLRRVLSGWPADDSTRAVLARTNRELLPAAAAALELGMPFRAERLRLPLEDPWVDRLLEAAAIGSGPAPVRLVAAARTLRADGGIATDADAEPGLPVAEADPSDDGWPAPVVAASLVAWSLPYADLGRVEAKVRATRNLLVALRRDDAALTLATAHATKGLEFDHVAVIGLDEHRFPSARSIADAADPERALEEERRLAHVAWTRARVSLTLVYDPDAPSRFLLEAFTADELG